MLCDRCNQNKATLHVTRTVEGNVTELHLCSLCAKDQGLEDPSQLSLSDILAGFSDIPSNQIKNKALALPRCNNCGMTFNQFKSGERLGCASCYQAFYERLGEVLKRIHGRASHKGKSPLGGFSSIDEKEVLQKALKEAIEKEDFEKAATLRDQLRQLNQAPGSQEKKDLS